jgi:hypothetical protein
MYFKMNNNITRIVLKQHKTRNIEKQISYFVIEIAVFTGLSPNYSLHILRGIRIILFRYSPLQAMLQSFPRPFSSHQYLLFI